MTEPAPEQKTPPDIGSVLRQARTNRGQSLEAVFQHTRIPKKFIEALEANRFEVFPAAVYLQGFLKTYCDHLEVDFDSLWSQIQPPKQKPPSEFSASSAENHPSTSSSTPESENEQPAPRLSGNSVESRPSSNTGKFLLLLAALIAAGALWSTHLLSVHKPSAPNKPAVPFPAPVHIPASIAPLHATEGMKLRIIFRHEGWMRVHADGHLRFEGRAPTGYTQEWTAMEFFMLRTLKPDDIDLTLDGHPVHLDPSLQNSSGDYKITRPQGL